jgi:hypothetical protein
MSRDQIITLGYFGSVPRCNNRLKQLLDHGFVRRYRHLSRGSASQALYSLGGEGSILVSDRLDIELDEVVQQTRRDAPTLFLEHTLGLVDLRIEFTREALLRGLGDFEWLPEPLCRHEYSVRQSSGVWKPRVLKPDAFVRWSKEGRSHSFFIELDLGHVGSAAFLLKAGSYRTYLSLGVFAEVYEAESFDVLVVTTGERRLAHLQASTTGSGIPRFLFTTLSRLKEADPFGHIWRSGKDLVSLPGGSL